MHLGCNIKNWQDKKLSFTRQEQLAALFMKYVLQVHIKLTMQFVSTTQEVEGGSEKEAT